MLATFVGFSPWRSGHRACETRSGPMVLTLRTSRDRSASTSSKDCHRPSHSSGVVNENIDGWNRGFDIHCKRLNRCCRSDIELIHRHLLMMKIHSLRISYTCDDCVSLSEQLFDKFKPQATVCPSDDPCRHVSRLSRRFIEVTRPQRQTKRSNRCEL